jgi:hypothetical protein
MGHHNPKHLKTDLQEMQAMKLDDVLLCLQENDFVHFNGKLNFTPTIARDHGVRPIAIFWGALNLFGGGRSSQFLLENPAGFQVGRNGEHRPQGCYVNELCLRRIKEMIDLVAERGYEGYFVDEPTPLDGCFCSACKSQYETWYGGNLLTATAEQQAAFRQRCVIDYIAKISDYCKANHPALETMCCLMLSDKDMWTAAAQILSLDNLGTDIYWVNYDYDVEEMAPHVQALRCCARTWPTSCRSWRPRTCSCARSRPVAIARRCTSGSGS